MEENKRLHGEFRGELLKRQLSNTENYDKAILTISSSGLGLTLALYNIAATSSNNSIPLVTAWIFYVLAITTCVASYKISNKALDIQGDIAYEYYIKNNSDAFHKKNIYSSINNALNSFSGAFLVIAIFLSLIFFYTVIKSKEINMAENNKTNQPVFDSASVPRMTLKTDSAPKTNSAEVPRMQAVPAPSPPAESAKK